MEKQGRHLQGIQGQKEGEEWPGQGEAQTVALVPFHEVYWALHENEQVIDWSALFKLFNYSLNW